MAQLTLKVVRRKQTNQFTKKEGYYSRVVSNGILSFDDVCKEASVNTTLHPRELALAFGLALDVVGNALKNGMIVDLDQIGRLYPAVQSKWTETKEGQRLSDMEKLVKFRPSKAVKDAVKGAKLAWASDEETFKGSRGEVEVE